MLKVGVLGAGHLGKIHLRLLQQSQKYELVGFYDENQENGQKIAKEFGYKQFKTIATLIHAVDVIDIVTPTLSHYKCAKVAIKSGKHVFIEKPISNTVAEAEEIIDAGVKSFVHWLDQRSDVPLIQQLNQQAEAWRAAELQRAQKMLAKGEPVEAVLEAMAKGLTQKMLHGAMSELHADEAHARQEARSAIEHFFLRPSR